MSIFHTLKRKLRSCRRQQDAVLANSTSSHRCDSPSSSYEKDFQKILTQLESISVHQSADLEPWVLAALARMESIGAAERLWKSTITSEEVEAFSRKAPEVQEEILNKLLDRVMHLRHSCNGQTCYVMSGNKISLKFNNTGRSE